MIAAPIHPFPARMAPELALEKLDGLRSGAVVVDPMVGSGTVIRQAIGLGLRGLGFDVDPLSVLLSRVSTRFVPSEVIDGVCQEVRCKFEQIPRKNIRLSWIDDVEEHAKFVKYWFGDAQRDDLYKLAFILSELKRTAQRGYRRGALEVLQVGLSRIIVTKQHGASLAWDVSHSRPHKIAQKSEFAVMPAFIDAVARISRGLPVTPTRGRVKVTLGDARCLKGLKDGTVDAVLTSPPYLNAIDYLRGHRMSLIWLGYTLGHLRRIRAEAIGAERAPDAAVSSNVSKIIRALGDVCDLPHRQQGMVSRYALDLFKVMKEIARILKPGGEATLVVGDSCLRGLFIENSRGAVRAAEMVGLRLRERSERELPDKHRYLPPPSAGSLGRRMRTEVVLTFRHA